MSNRPIFKNLEEAKEILLRQTSTFNISAGLARSVLWESSKRISDFNIPHSYCHSYLNNAEVYQEDSLVGNCSSINKKAISLEILQAWIKYLISPEMPLNKNVLNKDDFEHCVNAGLIFGYVSYNMHPAYVETLWICKAMRQCHETPWVVELWFQLVKAGVHPLFAHAVAAHFYKTVSNRWQIFGVGGHACVWGVLPKYEDIPYILQWRLNPNRSIETYTQFVRLDDGIEIKSGFKELIKQSSRSDGWGGTIEDKDASIESIINWCLEEQANATKK